MFYTNIDKTGVFCVVHGKLSLLMRRHSEYGTRDCDERLFQKGFESDISRMLESLAKLSNILGYIQNFNQRDKIQRRVPCLLLQIFLNVFKMLFPKGTKYIPK